MDIVEIRPVCALCEVEMTEVRVTRCAGCERYGPEGRRHFRCENPRCQLPGKTTICCKLNQEGPEA